MALTQVMTFAGFMPADVVNQQGLFMDSVLTTEQFEEWYNALPILPYGELCDDELLDNFKQILTWKHERIFISDNIPNGKFTTMEYWLMLGLLRDCIDYGTSPRGAWLTDFGTKLLAFLNAGEHIKYLENTNG